MFGRDVFIDKRSDGRTEHYDRPCRPSTPPPASRRDTMNDTRPLPCLSYVVTPTHLSFTPPPLGADCRFENARNRTTVFVEWRTITSSERSRPIAKCASTCNRCCFG